jgi:hypothetical protein
MQPTVLYNPCIFDVSLEMALRADEDDCNQNSYPKLNLPAAEDVFSTIDRMWLIIRCLVISIGSFWRSKRRPTVDANFVGILPPPVMSSLELERRSWASVHRINHQTRSICDYEIKPKQHYTVTEHMTAELQSEASQSRFQMPCMGRMTADGVGGDRLTVEQLAAGFVAADELIHP